MSRDPDVSRLGLILVLLGLLPAVAAIAPPPPPPHAAGWQLWAEGDVGIGQTFRLRLDIMPFANVTDFTVMPAIRGPLAVQPAEQRVDLVAGQPRTMWWNATAGEGAWYLGFTSDFDEDLTGWDRSTGWIRGHAYPTGAWASGDARGTPPKVNSLDDTEGWHGWTRAITVRHHTTWRVEDGVAVLDTVAATDAPWNDHLEEHGIEMRVGQLCHWPPGSDTRWQQDHPRCPPPTGPAHKTQVMAKASAVPNATFRVEVPRNDTTEYPESRVVQLFHHSRPIGADLGSWGCYWTGEFAWHGDALVLRPARPVSTLMNWLDCTVPDSAPDDVVLQAEPYGLAPCTYPIGYGYPMFGSDWAPERRAAADNGTLWWQVGEQDPLCEDRLALATNAPTAVPSSAVTQEAPTPAPPILVPVIGIFAGLLRRRGPRRN